MTRSAVAPAPSPSTVGSQFEKGAEDFLNENDLQTLRRNYKCKFGEVDLIMEEHGFLVFVEVRFRRNNSFGGPLESITLAKQKRVIRSASYFLSMEPKFQNHPCRFDVVGVTQNNTQFVYDWIRDAFST